jgi:hypothetical protein
MPVVYGNVITSTQVGQRLEHVACEKCATEFYYELTRVGVGKGSALYNIGQQGAAQRAQIAATQNLGQRLDQEAELVPCPKCHWVNQDLVDRYRQRKYRNAPIIIGLIIAAGFITSPIIWAALDEWLGYKSSVPVIVSRLIMAVTLASPLYVLFVRRLLRARINPNATYPRVPKVPPGTPPALTPLSNPDTGELFLAPVVNGNQLNQANDQTNWAVFRPAQISFPPVCCVCLERATTRYRSPLMVNQRSEFAVPLCATCSTRLTRRWWLTLMIIVLFCTGAAVLAATTLPFGERDRPLDPLQHGWRVCRTDRRCDDRR